MLFFGHGHKCPAGDASPPLDSGSEAGMTNGREGAPLPAAGASASPSMVRQAHHERGQRRRGRRGSPAFAGRMRGDAGPRTWTPAFAGVTRGGMPPFDKLRVSGGRWGSCVSATSDGGAAPSP